MEKQRDTVVVIGAWHLGSVIGARLAEIGSEVYLWDSRLDVRSSWRSGSAPLFEPGLNELVALHWGKNLFWCDELASALSKATWVIIAYDTPVNEQDQVELGIVEDGVTQLIKGGINPNSKILFTSQLPVGATRHFGKTLREECKWTGRLLYQPENLRLGSALESIRKPDRIALGIDREDGDIEREYRNLFGLNSVLLSDRFLLKLEESSRIEVPRPTASAVGASEVTAPGAASAIPLRRSGAVPIEFMSLESAEMVKHALNAFLATCVVFANELSEVCEMVGADAWVVAKSLRKDGRLSPKTPILPGLGFSGATLARDVRILSDLAEKNKPHSLFSSLYNLNQQRNDWIVRSLKKNLGNLGGEKVTLLGVTYKPDTSTVRRSPAIAIGNLLRAEGAICVAVDPMADIGELSSEEREKLPFAISSSIEEAFNKSSAAILITEWKEFSTLNWQKLLSSMRSQVIVDTKAFLSNLASIPDIKYIVPGKP